MAFGNSYGGGNSPLARLTPAALLLIPAVLMIARGCHEGPFGRRQLVLMSVEEQKQLGAQAFQQVLQQNRGKVVQPFLTDGEPNPQSTVVERIGQRLAKASTRNAFLEAANLKPFKFDWDFRVVRDPQRNAFCLPGGKVVVFTGIFPVCKDENGLAAVMGHEIGHALAQHGAERMAQQKIVQLGQIAAATAFGGNDPQQQRQILALLGAGAQYGVLLPFSRQHETEADKIGLYLMATAGYDPKAAASLWVRMKEASAPGQRPPEFASTHPAEERRAHSLTEWAMDPTVQRLYAQSDKQDGTKLLPR